MRLRVKELEAAHFSRNLLLGPGGTLDEALVQRAQVLYNTGRPVGALRNLILGVRDFREQNAEGGAEVIPLRFRRAWRAVRKWESTEPGECHIPLPELHWKAMIGVCLLMGTELFLQVAEQLILCFGAALRPGEGLALRVRDLVFAVTLGYSVDRTFVRLEHHKGVQRGHGRPQHATLRDPVLSQWLRRRAAGRDPEARLWQSPPTHFRRFFDQVVVRCGLQTCGFTPSSLRAGAATALYIADAPVGDVAWALRHRSPETLRFYIQELGAALARSAVPGSLPRLEVFARAAAALLSGSL